MTGASNGYPEAASHLWLLSHGAAYAVGGVTFFVGGFDYISPYAGQLHGGWMFTIGSSGFLIADLMEWWTNNRVGCCCDEGYEEAYEAANAHVFSEPRTTTRGRWQRAEVGLNFAFSVLGSALYLVGSVLFIPEADSLLLGLWVFAAGSLTVSLSQAWKLVRSFSRGTWSADLIATGVDGLVGAGAACYLAGSLYFLPGLRVGAAGERAAAYWYMAGGVAYLVCAGIVCQRYAYVADAAGTEAGGVRGGISVSGSSSVGKDATAAQLMQREGANVELQQV